ncbi:NAD(P)-binding protein [Sarocladium strictum]
MSATQATDKVSIVIVGGGSIARAHASFIIKSPTCYLRGVVDPFPLGKELATSLGAPYYESLAKMLSDNCQPDIYLVSVPNGLHVEVATEILNTAQSPKVIMVEKPLSIDGKSGTELLALAREKGCTITVGHHRRFQPPIKAAKATIESGALGSLTAFSGLWMCKKHDGYYQEAPWRAARSSGGGPVWTNLVHDVDLIAHLTGAKIVRLWAQGTTRRRKHPGVNDPVEEGASVMLQFANGVVGTLILCDNTPSPYAFEPATGENPLIAEAELPVDCYRFFGNEGSLSVPDLLLWKYKQEVADTKGLPIGWNIPISHGKVPYTNGAPLGEQIEHLGRVARGLEAPVCSGQDGLEAVKVCEAIINALDNGDGSPVDIE